MSFTKLRMKNKQTTKIHLDTSGGMVVRGVKSASDSASKGISAQPGNPLSQEENKGNRGPMPSELSAKASEPSTGAPAERVAPNTVPDADKQPAPKQLEESPSQRDAAKTVAPTEDPSASSPAPAPHQKVPAATSDKVLKNEQANKSVEKQEASKSVSGESPSQAPQAPKVKGAQKSGGSDNVETPKETPVVNEATSEKKLK